MLGIGGEEADIAFARFGDWLLLALQFRQLIVNPRTRVADLVAHVLDTLWLQFQPINDLFGHVTRMIG